MAAKLLHSLSDDKVDLQRQIGCMTGIFQLFDRQQIISSRRLGGLSPKKLSSGNSHTYGGTFESESDSVYHRPKTNENNLTKNVHEKRVSVESARPSFSSSSRSSSFSSVDCNIKINQPEPSSYDRIIFPETPSRDPSMSQTSPLHHYARSSLDLRDLVKDSIYKESYYVSKDSRASFESNSGESMYCVSKNARRFSCDGRENKIDTKHKELPRLSLDCREHSTRSFNTAVGPSVVAKLMGLETLPKADVANEKKGSIKSCLDDDYGTFSRSSKLLVLPVSNSMRTSWKDPASPRRRDGIEPAPWKHPDGPRGSHKPSLRNVKTLQKPIKANIPNVYSEIEKRFKDLEFTQSGKDLRALKQILEAMQAKGLLDSSARREGLDGNSATQKDPLINTRLVNKERGFESPIIIMKPAKLVQNPRRDECRHNRKALTSNRASKEQVKKTSLRENRTAVCMTSPRPLKLEQSLIRSQNLVRENATSLVKSTTSVSPRLQQKKLELEKRSRPPISPDSNKTKRQPINNQPESSSPGGKRRPKIVKKQQKDDQLSEMSSETKGLSYQEDDLEGTSLERCSETNGSRSPSLKAAKYAVSGLSQQRFTSKLIEEGDLAESRSVTREQPSPVSVLDDTMYVDDAPSPVKRRPDVFKDEATITVNHNTEEQKKTEYLVSNSINRKKLENIENLVQKLKRLNSTHDEAHTDYIASLCENANPDHRYISEILLASGLLLSDLNSSLLMFQLHPSGHPINPELFLVLEQTKASTLKKEIVVRINCDVEKFRRKLIFDAVNEILAKKLTFMGTSNNTKLAKRSLNAQMLLKDLCSEIENFQIKKTNFVLEDEDDSLKSILYEDVMNRSESWTDFNDDLAGLVLDTERLIYKDLISEIVQGEAVRTKAGRRCRQLFV